MAAEVEKLCSLLSLGEVPDLSMDDNWTSFIGSITVAVENFMKQRDSFEKEAMEAKLRKVNLEQMLKNLQHKRVEEQAELDKANSMLEESKSRIAALETLNKKDSEDLNLIKSDLERSEAEIETLRARNDRFENEKVDLLRLLERRKVEIDGLNNQIESQSIKLRELREDTLRKDSELIEIQAKLSSSQLQFQMVKDELEKSKQTANWNSQELEHQINEFTSYRKSKSAELAAVNAKLEALEQENTQLQEKLTSLRSVLTERDSKVDELLRRKRDLENEMAERESAFIQEMSAKSRLAELYKDGLDDATMRLEEADNLIEIAKVKSNQVDEQIRKVQDECNQEISSMKLVIDEKDKEILLLKNHLDEIGALVPGASSPVPNLSSFSPSAAGAERIIQSSSSSSSKTFSDVYSEYAKNKTELLKANQEIEKLKKCIQDICQDLESRVPILQMERKENERLKLDLAKMSENLLQVNQEKDENVKRINGMDKELKDVYHRNVLLEQQVRDLSKQVQSLLREMEGEENLGSFSDISEEKDSDFMDSDQVINERLVVFKNIQELQVRNQELLQIVRELSQQQETAELERLKQTEEEMRHKLEQTSKELDDLKETRKRQAALVDSLVRQRDMLRDMVSSKEPTLPLGDSFEPENNNNLIKFDGRFENLRMEFNLYKEEKEKSEKYLEQQLETARSELSEVRCKSSQANAQLQFSQERYDLLKQNYEMEKKELDYLRKSNSEALNSIMQHQSQIHQLMGELLACKDSLQRLSNQLSSLKVELEMTKSNEQRILNEKNVIQQEKERLSSLLNSLQAIATEHEGSETDLKQRMNQQIEFLERELQAARSKVVEEVEAHKLAVASSDREYRELVRRYDQLMETYNKGKEEIVQSRIQLIESNRKISDMEILLARNDQRLQQLMVPTSPGNTDDMPRELAATRAKLAALEDELKLERDHISSYKEIAKVAENNLNDLSKTYDDYRISTENRIAELDRKLEQVQASESSLNNKLEDLENERSNLLSELEKSKRSFAQEKQELNAQLESLKEYESMASTHSSMRKEDISRLQELVEEMRQRYEQEVVAHGRDLEVLNQTKSEILSVNSKLNELQNILTNTKQELNLSEQTLNSERSQHNSELLDLQRRISELESQNNILLGQIENLAGKTTKRMSSIMSDTTLEGADSPMGDSDKSSLLEVVRYLRRQKDILQIEHDSMSIEYRRLKSQSENLQRSLDESRAMLEEERKGNQWQAKMAAEYNELLSKVSQLNILRESNITLRNEAETLAQRVKSLENEIKILKEQLEPKEEENRILHAKISAVSEELRILREDRDNWKNRFDQILVKYDRVDPSELDRLKEEKADLELQLSTGGSKVEEIAKELEIKNVALGELTNKFNQLEAKYKAVLQNSRQIAKVKDELSKRVVELESASSSIATPVTTQPELESTISNLEAEKERLLSEQTNLQTEIGALRSELEEKTSRLEKFADTNKKLNKLREQYKESQDQFKTLKEQLMSSESRFEDLKKENELRNSVLTSNWQSRVKKLTLEMEELKKQLGLSPTSVVSPTATQGNNSELGKRIQEIEPEAEKLKKAKSPIPPPEEEEIVEPEIEEGQEEEVLTEEIEEDEEESGEEPITEMMGMDEDEEMLPGIVSDEEPSTAAETTEETAKTQTISLQPPKDTLKNRVIDLSEIGKRTTRPTTQSVAQASQPSQHTPHSQPQNRPQRGGFRGRGGLAGPRRVRRGGGGTSHHPESST